MRFARRIVVGGVAVLVGLPGALRAQEKERFATLEDALRSGGALAGGFGPRDVNWIEGGRRFSFTTRTSGGQEIRAFDPASGRDTLVFTARGKTFPGGSEPFAYASFQWSADSRHLVFQTHFDNQAAYDESSAVKHADRLTGHLLLIHSMMDDNVHPANTMRLLTALADAGHDADLRIYPPGRHGAAYSRASALLIREATFRYLETYLKSGARP